MIICGSISSARIRDPAAGMSLGGRLMFCVGVSIIPLNEHLERIP